MSSRNPRTSPLEGDVLLHRSGALVTVERSSSVHVVGETAGGERPCGPFFASLWDWRRWMRSAVPVALSAQSTAQRGINRRLVNPSMARWNDPCQVDERCDRCLLHRVESYDTRSCPYDCNWVLQLCETCGGWLAGDALIRAHVLECNVARDSDLVFDSETLTATRPTPQLALF